MPTSAAFHPSSFAAAMLCAIGTAVIVACSLFAPPAALGQSESASVSGRVTDPAHAVVPDAEVEMRNTDTGVAEVTKTNGEGFYSFPALKPGHYLMSVRKPQFKTVTVTGITLNVQDSLSHNFALPVGSVAESITVRADALHINTTDASVSTVVDRQFAENLPLNGRSFQTLIDLTPGVVLTVNGDASGQFSVNGQRSASNYWTVDGVSANVGSSVLFGGNQISGAVGTTSVLGGTNSLVSVDALQEFRIQTSTFAPEFGRTPGGQISIVTRSGTNGFHGSVFDYLRNDVLDANNWFNTAQTPALRKAEERQNDFGGTFSGPVFKDKTFFFFSYEGLRLRLPTTTLTEVPDAAARANATAALKPFLDAYPLDPLQPDLGNGIAQFNASYSNPATLDASSLRVDQRLGEKVSLFGRYNYSPSEVDERGGSGTGLSSVFRFRTTVQTGTVGLTWALSTRVVDEFRFNYSRTNAGGNQVLDGFGGATPLQALPFPSPFTTQNGNFFLGVFSLGANGNLEDGAFLRNVQRQFNVVDNVSVQKGSHSLKFGVDYRRLSPQYEPAQYMQAAFFNDVPSLESGSLALSLLEAHAPATFLFRNVSAFTQDTWRLLPRLTLTYGLRWDTDFVPSSLAGPNIPGVSGFDLGDLSHLALAPPGTPAFKTTFGNFAPRLGVAYQLLPSQNFTTVVRGGFGVFYDLATSETANVLAQTGFPFGTFLINFGGTFPLPAAVAAAPPIVPPNAANGGILNGFDPNLKLPYTFQWNFSVEQGLGQRQTVSASYIGAAGRRLLQTDFVNAPNPAIAIANLVSNTGTSDYDALQLQFHRSLTAGLQALASYSWSHSLDTASAGFVASGSNAGGPNANRGPSDFDVRNAFSAGLTYAIPSLKSNALLKAIAGGWSLQSIILAQSAPPLTVLISSFSELTNGFGASIRPDVTPGIPLYLFGPQFPGGKAINNTPGAVPGGCPNGSPSIGPFCNPPVDANGNPIRQGNLGRNVLRGFGTTQVDFAVHRDFPIRESLKMQFRAEMFNVLNHPNFGPPDGILTDPHFGVSTQLLGQFLSGGNLGGGGLSPLYQIGGPRSIQLALKFVF